ncbi:FmdB family zinc ribbon protein [Naumannella halotolerans]|uniref:Putative FmdB family regulatory protein n=1 Tax=Naumannella halotolerans TaxID=993414 RepID=A0A4R7J5M8_9ACTN|nr:FmdB family zinc ribbon protein [Naumannella halotolerans]TDT32465.1 putative FmdB family regulatory protein [Naumannella halotolerans]
MPTYQYRCTECGHDLEAVQKFSDAPLTECPACGGKLRKVYNAVGVVFKGSGFYKTDSRSNGSTKSTHSSSHSDKSSDSGSDSSSKSDSSPSTSTDSGSSKSTDSGSSKSTDSGSSSSSSTPAGSGSANKS